MTRSSTDLCARPIRGSRGLRLASGLALALTTAASGAIDGDVSWGSLSHLAEFDRRPLCPVDNLPFEVRFQTARGDLTAARVLVSDVSTFPVAAEVVERRGPYDVWRASIPATVSDRVRYVIELIDGTDRDYLSPDGVTDGLPGSDRWWQLDFATLSHAPLGASPTPSGTVFRVWAPGATSAQVRGTFTGWGPGPSMTRLGDDFIAMVPGARVGDEYKYYFNNRDWRPDPRGRQLANSGYNTRIIDPHAYAWRHPEFTPRPPEEWVVYQLHVSTFAGRNDPAGATPTYSRYRDVTARVGHLAELGVTAVMLNPTNEFPGERSGGYNSITQFAFETSRGTADELREMIDTLHGAGIAVILDTVWNHFPSNDNFLWDYDGTQHWFDSPVVGTPWGPQADMDRDEVIDYYMDSVEIVMGEFRMDGYRHDAVYELVSASQWAGGQRLIRGSMDLIHRRHDDTHVVGEIYNNDAWNTSPGGMNLDGQYHEAYKNAIKAAIDAAAFGDPDVSRLAAAIDGSGPWVEGERVFNYYELHDETWPLSGAGRTRSVKYFDTTFPHDDRYAKGRTKLANGLTLLARGMPAILMGTEWLEDADWEFEKIDWSKKETYRGVFDYYRHVIGLRTTRPALFANSGCSVYHVNDGANVLAFERFGPDGRSYVVLANFSNTDFGEYIIGVPRSGPWGVILNSEDGQYQGTGFGSRPGPVAVESGWRDGHGQFVRTALPAHGLLILQHEPEYIVDPCVADLTGDGNADILDILAYFEAYGAGDLAADLAPVDAPDGRLDLFDILAYFQAFAFGCP